MLSADTSAEVPLGALTLPQGNPPLAELADSRKPVSMRFAWSKTRDRTRHKSRARLSCSKYIFQLKSLPGTPGQLFVQLHCPSPHCGCNKF